MPISQPQWTVDVALKKQQRFMGITAAVLSKGLDLMEAPMAEITEIAEASPVLEHKERLLEAISQVQGEAMTPIGHVLRFLAAGYNDVAMKRRELLANAVSDKFLQQQLRGRQLGFTSFFKEDTTAILTAAAARQNQRQLTSDSRRPLSRPQERTRSPVRRYNDDLHRSPTPTHRGSFRGSSSRGRRPFRGAASSRGGRGNKNGYNNNKHA